MEILYLEKSLDLIESLPLRNPPVRVYSTCLIGVVVICRRWYAAHSMAPRCLPKEFVFMAKESEPLEQ